MKKNTKPLNKDAQAIDDAKMDKVSGGWKAGEGYIVDRSDQNFDYEDVATDYATVATHKRTGKKWVNDGTGWKDFGANGVSQYGQQW